MGLSELITDEYGPSGPATTRARKKGQDIDRSSLFKDGFRNGYILCLLISKVYGKTMSNICKFPNSIQECSHNVEIALGVLRENPEGLPYDLLWKKESIMKGDGLVIYPLI